LRRLAHRFVLRLAIMAVMALLIAQLGALSHAYAHDPYAPGAHSRNTGSHGASAHDTSAQDAYDASRREGYHGHDSPRRDAYRRDFAGAATTRSLSAGSHDPCGDCLAYAPLLAAAGTTSVPPFALPQGRSAAERVPTRSLIDPSPLLAFRSRAPPAAP
jgi:hypothetical protein